MIHSLFIAFISGLLTLDNTICQIMISRPIVSGTIIGYLLGDIKSGLLIGSLIELIWIRVIPVGELPPNTTVIAILATYWYLLSSTPNIPIVQYQIFLNRNLHFMLLAILFAIPFGIVYKKLEILHRQLNVKFAKLVDRKISEGKENIISYVIFIGVFISFVKSFVFYILLFSTGRLFLRQLNFILSPAIKTGLNFALVVLPSIGLAAIFSAFYKKAYTARSAL